VLAAPAPPGRHSSSEPRFTNRPGAHRQIKKRDGRRRRGEVLKCGYLAMPQFASLEPTTPELESLGKYSYSTHMFVRRGVCQSGAAAVWF
jgi:hypothetical protein